MMIREPLTATYDVTPRAKAAKPFMIYAGLWQTLAAQNSSANMILPEAYLRDDQGHSVQTVMWLDRATALRSKPRSISLVEAQNIAVQALLGAENRRQAERQREAAFWASLEEE